MWWIQISITNQSLSIYLFVCKFSTTSLSLSIFYSLSHIKHQSKQPSLDRFTWLTSLLRWPTWTTLHTRLYLPFRFCCTGCPVIFGPLSLSLLIVKCHQLRLAGWWCDSTKSQLSIRLFTLLAFVRHATPDRRDTPPIYKYIYILCVYMCVYVCVCIYIYIYIYIYMYVGIRVCIYIYVYTVYISTDVTRGCNGIHR